VEIFVAEGEKSFWKGFAEEYNVWFDVACDATVAFAPRNDLGCIAVV